MRQNAHFFCLQGIRMLRSTKEEQKTDVWSAEEKIEQPKNKFTALLNFFVKIQIQKINVK